MSMLSRLDGSFSLEKQRKKAHSVKLEMKGIFLRKDYQNLTMISTNELSYLDSSFNGPELVKLCLKKIKCKKILSGTRKLKTFWRLSNSMKNNQEKNQDEKFWLEKYTEKYPNTVNTRKEMRKAFKPFIKKRLLDGSKRMEIWLNVANVKNSIDINPMEYFILKEIYTDYPDIFYHQIDVDLKRTFGNIAKLTMHEKPIEKMRNVLQAYAKRNPYVGYCQGLNFVLEFVMRLKFTEEELFWILVHLIEVVLPLDYYSTMTGVIVDEKILHEMIEIILPDLSQKFKNIELDTSIFSIPWFICLFTSTKLDEKIIFIIWDHLFIEGSVALLKASLAILKLLRKEIMKTDNIVDAVRVLEEKTKELNNLQEFNKTMNSFEISKKVLNFAREKYRTFLIEGKEEAKKNQKPKKSQSNNASINCNLHWPICSLVLENAKIDKPEMEFFIFKYGASNEEVLYEQYFQEIPQKQKIPFINMKDNLVIGRYEHICMQEEKPEEENKSIKKISFEIINEYSDCENKNKIGTIHRRNKYIERKSRSQEYSFEKSFKNQELYAFKRNKSEELEIVISEKYINDMEIPLELFPRLTKLHNFEKIGMLSQSKSIDFLKSLVLIRKDSFILNKIPGNSFSLEERN